MMDLLHVLFLLGPSQVLTKNSPILPSPLIYNAFVAFDEGRIGAPACINKYNSTTTMINFDYPRPGDITGPNVQVLLHVDLPALDESVCPSFKEGGIEICLRLDNDPSVICRALTKAYTTHLLELISGTHQLAAWLLVDGSRITGAREYTTEFLVINEQQEPAENILKDFAWQASWHKDNTSVDEPESWKISMNYSLELSTGEASASEIIFEQGKLKSETVRKACNNDLGISLSSPHCQALLFCMMSITLYVPYLPHAPVADIGVTRWQILLKIREKYEAYSRYLEIGCNDDSTFGRLRDHFDVAIGVDPAKGGTHRMTSDAFFAQNTRTFDLIFIDGLHEASQVLKDIKNALTFLSPGGLIVMHDCNPGHAESALPVRLAQNMGWNGDVWRAFVQIRTYSDVAACVIDVDEGVGLVKKRPNSHPLPADQYDRPDLDYHRHLDHNREYLLQLKTVQEAFDWLDGAI